MIHIHYDFEVGPDQGILVSLDRRANVLLMDDENYERYADGRPYRYHGGYPKELPAYLRPPSPGHWNVAIDLGGFAGSVRATAEVIPDTIDGPGPDDPPGRGLDPAEVLDLIRERVGAGGRVVIEGPDRDYGLLPGAEGSFRLVPMPGE